jgi:hypothetical protein
MILASCKQEYDFPGNVTNKEEGAEDKIEDLHDLYLLSKQRRVPQSTYVWVNPFLFYTTQFNCPFSFDDLDTHNVHLLYIFIFLNRVLKRIKRDNQGYQEVAILGKLPKRFSFCCIELQRDDRQIEQLFHLG